MTFMKPFPDDFFSGLGLELETSKKTLPVPPKPSDRDATPLSWLARTVKWLRAEGESYIIQIAKKILAYVLAAFLAFSIVGIVVVVEAVREWKHQNSVALRKVEEALKKAEEREKAITKQIEINKAKIEVAIANEEIEALNAKKEDLMEGKFENATELEAVEQKLQAANFKAAQAKLHLDALTTGAEESISAPKGKLLPTAEELDEAKKHGGVTIGPFTLPTIPVKKAKAEKASLDAAFKAAVDLAGDELEAENFASTGEIQKEKEAALDAAFKAAVDSAADELEAESLASTGATPKEKGAAHAKKLSAADSKEFFKKKMAKVIAGQKGSKTTDDMVPQKEQEKIFWGEF